MKLGLVSAILDGWTMEEMVDTVSEMGFQCVEVACWPQGKAERRYAGVSHIDVARVLEDDQYAKYVLDSFAAKKVQISSLVTDNMGRIRFPRTGAIPPRPFSPVPLTRCISTVSALSSAV